MKLLINGYTKPILQSDKTKLSFCGNKYTNIFQEKLSINQFFYQPTVSKTENLEILISYIKQNKEQKAYKLLKTNNIKFN